MQRCVFLYPVARPLHCFNFRMPGHVTSHDLNPNSVSPLNLTGNTWTDGENFAIGSSAKKTFYALIEKGPNAVCTSLPAKK